jgi:hypothetical protein
MQALRYILTGRCRQAAQKELRGEAREKSTERRRTQPVRWSEAIELNEAYEPFSAAC